MLTEPMTGPIGRETMKTATIASRILENLLYGDGCRDTTRLGVDRYALVRRIAASTVRDHLGNVTGWTFADGSEIEEFGGGWDTPEGWQASA